MRIGLGIGIPGIFGPGHNGGPPLDADAEAYIAAANALFPAAVNALVLKIKADGNWDKLTAVKLAIGVPALTDSLIDLRNPSLNGTAVNTPGHDPEEGWSFTAASSQYIDSKFNPSVHAWQNSAHIGVRLRAHTTGAAANLVDATGGLICVFGMSGSGNGTCVNCSSSGIMSVSATAPGHIVGARTAASAQKKYKNGATVTSNTANSATPINGTVRIGAQYNGSSLSSYLTGRITAFHAGVGLADTDVANLTDAFDAYAAACGEA